MKSALLNPQVSVGDIKLGANIEDYPNRQLEYSYLILGVPNCTYSFSENPVTAFADERGNIEGIHCEVECLWRGANLIGMNIADFEKLARQSHSGEVDHIHIETAAGEQLQKVHEYDDLGLQIWVFADAIVAIIASDYRE